MDFPVHDPLRKTVIGKLVKGKDSATRLQTLLQKARGEPRSVLAEELAVEIERSFVESISILKSCETNELSQIADTDGPRRVSPVDRSSKGSDHGKKRPGVKDRRGCYRRRNSAQSWMVVSPTTEDEYAWRKYGQKEILNTKFPRCYFRCTHKHDQSCKATKQVQMIKEDPHLYQTTYFGHHTCQNTLMRTPQIISEVDPRDSYILSFETRTPPNRIIPCPISLTANQELKDETQSDVTDNKSGLGSSMWHDTTESSGPDHQKLEPSNTNSGVHNDQEVVSSFHSCSSTPLPGLDMEDFGTKFDDLENHLYMDEFFSN